MSGADGLAAGMFARIRANPQDFEAWSTLFMLMAASQDHAAIEKLIMTRQQLLGDGLGFFYYVMRDLLAMDRDSVALAVLGPIGAANILLPVAQYMRGLIACRQERSDQAIAAIRQAAALADHPAIQAFAARDQLFREHASQHIAAQAGFLLTAFELGALEPPALVPEIQFLGDADLPGATVLLAACDRGYFARFAPSLIASVAEVGAGAQGLHLHVVAPDAATLAAIEALLARYPYLRISTEAGARDTTYYACSRFLVAPALIERYRRPLVAIDVDAELRQPVGAALAALGDADLGWFETKGGIPVPSLKCAACLVALADTAGSRRFLDLYARYVALMLARGARWMVDQAGLWCLSRSRIGGFATTDLTAALGPGFGGIVLPADAKDDKRMLRQGSAGT